MDKHELDQARTNPEFINYLEETRQKAIEEKDIFKMYETMDSMLVLDLEEEKVNSLYEEILKVAFNEIQVIIDKNEKLHLQEKELLLTRAFYEHAIEKWSFRNFQGAKELIFVLANIIEDELLEKALNVSIVALNNEIDVDTFYEEHIDFDVNSSHDKYGYFMVDFKYDIDEFLEKNKELLAKEYSALSHLLDA